MTDPETAMAWSSGCSIGIAETEPEMSQVSPIDMTAHPCQFIPDDKQF